MKHRSLQPSNRLNDGRYTLEEYLALELSSNERYEYWNGEVICLSGASPNHDHIEGNLRLALRLTLREREYRVFTAQADNTDLVIARELES